MLPRRFRNFIIDAEGCGNDQLPQYDLSAMRSFAREESRRTKSRRRVFIDVFMIRDDMQAMRFGAATLKYSGSLASRCDFGTASLATLHAFFS
jgi:hypothetical protein